MLVFDLTDPESFEHVDDWREEVEKYAGQGIAKLLVGNKMDLEKDRRIDSEIAREYAHINGMKYIETSAKSFLNIDKIFQKMAETILQSRTPHIPRDKTVIRIESQNRHDQDKEEQKEMSTMQVRIVFFFRLF